MTQPTEVLNLIVAYPALTALSAVALMCVATYARVYSLYR
jgi:hypothetical protein